MANEKYTLTRIVNQRGSKLRDKFEIFKGEFASREICIKHVVGQEITNLEKRPEFHPNINVLQLKKLKDDEYYVYDEIIYTNDTYLDEFEKFLRANMISAPAKDFDEVPNGYKHFFSTPFDLVPVDISRQSTSIAHPNGDYTEVAHDQLKGVDFNSSCTLRMLEPGIVHKHLEQIEKTGNFTVVVKRVKMKEDTKNPEFLEAYEYRKGNEYNTVDHLIFELIK